MKNLLIALVLMFGITTAFADNGNKEVPSENSTNASSATTAVTGKVIDFQSGESLVGAEVKIEGTDVVAYTDLDGNFVFPNLKAGTYSIVISYISYKNSLVENMVVKTTSENTVEVQLIPERN
jgi:uncharacterized membrane protein